MSAAPRKDLLQILLVGVLTIMIGVIGFRFATGNTNADRAKARAEEEDMKRIMDAKQGDPVNFKSRLAADLEEQRLREEQRRRGILPTGSETNGNASDRPAPTATDNSQAERERAERDRLAKQEADMIEAEKRDLAIRSSKMNAFEDRELLSGLNGGAQSANGEGNNPAAALMSLLGRAGNPAEAPRATVASAGAVPAPPPPPYPGNGKIGTNNLGALGQLLGIQQDSSGSQGISSLSWEANQIAGTQTSPLMPEGVASPYLVHEGSSIPAVLLSAVDSDLPGDLRAQVSRDVYDTVSMRNLVIPQGTTLVGSYNSEVVDGQQRLLFGFSRMIFPNGVSVSLTDTKGRSNFRGSDRQGKSGLEAEVNTHFWKIFGPALLIGAVTNFASPKSTTNVSLSFGATAAETTSSALTETVKRILSRNQNIKPTLSLQAGERFNLVVARDMALPPNITTTRP